MTEMFDFGGRHYEALYGETKDKLRSLEMEYEKRQESAAREVFVEFLEKRSISHGLDEQQRQAWIDSGAHEDIICDALGEESFELSDSVAGVRESALEWL